MAIGTDCSDKKELQRSMFAEFLGTTFYVFMGCGSMLSSGMLNNHDGYSNNTSRLMPISMSFGISAVVLLYCISGITAGHMNPAVTLFLALIKKISPGRAGCYMAAQFLGAFFGGILLWAVSSEAGVHQYSLGANHLVTTLESSQGLLLEILGTLLVCMTVLFTEVKVGGPTDGKPNLSLLCIGLSIFVAHVTLVPFTRCGINPARTFGVSLVGEMVDLVDDDDIFFGPDCWIFYLGPVLASVIAAGIHFVFDDGQEESLVKENARQSEL